jgi:hypothetical protein
MCKNFELNETRNDCMTLLLKINLILKMRDVAYNSRLIMRYETYKYIMEGANFSDISKNFLK